MWYILLMKSAMRLRFSFLTGLLRIEPVTQSGENFWGAKIALAITILKCRLLLIPFKGIYISGVAT